MVKSMFKIVDGNKACAEAAYLFSEICPIYPITPSSPMAAEIDISSHDGQKNLFNEEVQVIEMQSEAGAAGTMHGALLTGSLATTFTASQGLLLMIPNMYKMAGEMLPGVIHVAARSLATHALSIFGDHQDIYAARATGFCMLASTNVQDAHNLAAVAHLSAIEARLPFLHFFDGFRTSHELNKIRLLTDKELLPLINFKKVNDFKATMLNVGSDVQRGLAENEDIYFQLTESRNQDYLAVPKIVAEYMTKINLLTGQDYRPFNYYGSPEATSVIVAMGSVVETIKLVVNDLVNQGLKVGVIEVHLYRPFSAEYLLNVLPQTVQKMAVLDRTKEAGSIGEPLYLDLLSALQGRDINIVGGRYGLSSKNTTPADIYSVFKMLSGQLKNNFTIGINDDVTNLSLPPEKYEINLAAKEILIYGFGSDGMVSASKDILKIIGDKSNSFIQGYFQYDSKKSGGVTACHLRIANNAINAPYYVTNPELLVITKEEYLSQYEMLNDIKEKGIILLCTNHQDNNFNAYLPNECKKIIKDKKLRLFVVDAETIALECGIKGKISKIIETIIFRLLNFNEGIEVLKISLAEQFKNKGAEIIAANLKAIEMALNSVREVQEELTIGAEEKVVSQDVFTIINNRQGDNLTVQELLPYKDGNFPNALSQREKRKIASQVAKWQKENCIQCEQCSIACPHGAIRPFAVPKGQGIPLLGNDQYDFVIAVSEADCTGCGICINNCPGKGGQKALSFGQYDNELQTKAQALFENHSNPELFDKYSVKGSQFIKPKFEFSGACAGCGETPYIKLLTQLFGDKLVIANATGCSSIYGGSVPSTPYSIPWANSLFEDNAEFGYGMLLSYQKTRNRIKNIMLASIDAVTSDIKELYQQWLDNSEDYQTTVMVKEKLVDKEIPADLKPLINYLPARSVWTIGGDGWAYDIGFGGIDHVLSSGANVNILVLDTEVYSNTGGQSSKSSRIGQIAEFADNGKTTVKKDLFKIAMNYPNCYVANVSLGSNFMQTIKAFKEAEEHQGPSIIIAYSPCIEHGIKGGLTNAVAQQKKAVDCGYLSLMRYNPLINKLTIDSREPNFDLYEDFIKSETRYSSLFLKNEEKAHKLINNQIANAKDKYLEYQKIAKEQE